MSEARPASDGTASQLIGAGVGIGALGAAGAVLVGVTCPLCVVAAPALITAGVAKKVRDHLRRRPSTEAPPGPESGEAAPPAAAGK